MFSKRNAAGMGLIAGISCLVASPAEAALFHFSYFFPDSISPETVFEGEVEGDANGDDLLNANILELRVVQDGAPVFTFGEADFNSETDDANELFTFSGTGVNITSNTSVNPGLTLVDGNTAAYIPVAFLPPFPGGEQVAEGSPDVREGVNWSLEPKSVPSVPEGNMSVVSWLALAAISGLSVKYGKRKSL
ncbi:MAG: hypothetical protein AB4060_10855 [Crocosphaera sp.]